jgi:hypothetical protein
MRQRIESVIRYIFPAQLQQSAQSALLGRMLGNEVMWKLELELFSAQRCNSGKKTRL